MTTDTNAVTLTDKQIATLKLLSKNCRDNDTLTKFACFTEEADAIDAALELISASKATGLTRNAIQKKSIEHGFEYWRASDSHGVTGTTEQAVEFLQDLLGVEVEIEDNAEPAQSFQSRVQPWMLACFGAEIAADTFERNHRFFEEAAELVQACGMTASEAHQLVDYTWSRPLGEKSQEVGGVMVTLAALCLANKLDMHADGETELARINQPDMIVRIRAKQASKPKHSPLPAAPAQTESVQVLCSCRCTQFPSCGCGRQTETRE